MSLVMESYYEISAVELAAWIEQQGEDRWWNVDGDPRLTGLMFFPAPGDELAAMVRRINNPLLVWDKNHSPQALGQVITRQQLDSLVSSVGEDFQQAKWEIPDPKPEWWWDRRLFLRWKDKPDQWILLEDSETTKKNREEVLAAKGG